MGDKQFPLSLVIRAVDKATAPLRAINERINKFTAPVRKLNNSFRALSAEAGLPKLAKAAKGVGASMKSVGSEVAGLALKVGALAAGAGVALFSIVRGAMNAGDDLATMAQRVGLGVDAFAQLQFAAAQADVEQEQFAASMDKFNKSLGEAKAGGGQLLAFLQKVSPALALQLKGAKNTEDALGLMTRAFERVTDPGKRAALASAAFGESGKQMGQFLGQGSKAIAEQRERFLELSGSQERFAAGAGDLDNAMRETETAFLGVRNAAMAELFPAFTELAREATKFLVANRGGIAKWAKEAATAIGDWVKGGGVERLAESLRSMAASVVVLTDRFGGLKTVAGGAFALFMAKDLIASVLGLGASLLSFAAAITPVVIKLGMWTGLLPWLGGLLENFGIWIYLYGLPGLAQLAAGFGSAALAAAPFIAAAIGLAAAGYAIYKNWKQLKELFTDFWGTGGMVSTLKEMNDFVEKHGQLGMWGEVFKSAGSWWGNELGITTGAAAALPPAAAPGGAARVTVDFNNLPKGTRVTQESSVPLDLGLGYSMVGP